ncbi:TPA_asm: hypothetical protein [Capsaspora MELD virus 1]|nr:TPA_asm: hypothetical protein [Capsaspora MELD virus 1]
MIPIFLNIYINYAFTLIAPALAILRALATLALLGAFFTAGCFTSITAGTRTWAGSALAFVRPAGSFKLYSLQMVLTAAAHLSCKRILERSLARSSRGKA